MILTIDVTGKKFVVTKAPFAKLDQHGEQRTAKQNGLPIWATQVVVTDSSGGDIITINTNADAPPDVEVGEQVEVVGLVANPWCTNGKSGVSYIADDVEVWEETT